MKTRIAAKSGAPLILRLMHTATFSCFAVSAIVLSRLEWVQLFRSQLQTYHVGETPRPIVIASSLTAGVGEAALLSLFVRKRRVPVSISIAILSASLAAHFFAVGDEGSNSRKLVDANVQILQVARDLARNYLSDGKRGNAPSTEAEWNSALARVVNDHRSQFRMRNFRCIPYRINLCHRTQAVSSLYPGTILVSQRADGRLARIGAVGVTADGQPDLVRTPLGKPIIYELPAAGAQRTDAASSIEESQRAVEEVN